MQCLAYPNQIQTIIDALRNLPPLANDVLTFLILDRLNTQTNIVKVLVSAAFADKQG